MALTFFTRCESATLDATHDFNPNGATEAATTAGTPSISATGAKVGSSGMVFDSVTDCYRYASATSNISKAVGSYGFWMHITNWVNGSWIIYARGVAGYQANITVELTAADELDFVINQDGGTMVNLPTTAANLSTNTWYFVTASWDQPNHKRRIRVYSAAGTLVQEVEDLVTTFTQPADLAFDPGLQFGDSLGMNWQGYLDNIFIGSAYEDADNFLANRNITSYTQYSTGGAPDQFVTIQFRP